MAIIQSYNKNFSGGIGDFIRGGIFLYKNCSNKDEFFIDFKFHPISNNLINKNESNIEYQEKDILNLDISKKTLHIQNAISKILSENHKNHYVSSFYHDSFLGVNQNLYKEIANLTLRKKEKIFFQNCFDFNENIKNEYENFLIENKLSPKRYTVIHFRLGDIELLSKESEEIINKITNKKKFKYEILYNRIIKNIDNKVVVLSDSNKFKSFVRNKENKKIIVPKTRSNHSVTKPGLLKLQEKEISIKNMFDLALDIKILSGSGGVISYSSNFWGSGFSFWISKIFDINIIMNRLY